MATCFCGARAVSLAAVARCWSHLPLRLCADLHFRVPQGATAEWRRLNSLVVCPGVWWPPSSLAGACPHCPTLWTTLVDLISPSVTFSLLTAPLSAALLHGCLPWLSLTFSSSSVRSSPGLLRLLVFSHWRGLVPGGGVSVCWAVAHWAR